MTIVYHWTTEENAKRILEEGLKENSYVCKASGDWDGEVCLEIIGDETFTWDNREIHYDWQARTEFIPPERIKVFEGDPFEV